MKQTDLTSKLSVPPDRDSAWQAFSSSTNSHATVIARLWVVARDEACRVLGAGRDEVTLTVVPPMFLDLLDGEVSTVDGRERAWVHPAHVHELLKMNASERLDWHRARAERPVARIPLRKSRKMKGAAKP